MPAAEAGAPRGRGGGRLGSDEGPGASHWPAAMVGTGFHSSKEEAREGFEQRRDVT